MATRFIFDDLEYEISVPTIGDEISLRELRPGYSYGAVIKLLGGAQLPVDPIAHAQELFQRVTKAGESAVDELLTMRREEVELEESQG